MANELFGVNPPEIDGQGDAPIQAQNIQQGEPQAPQAPVNNITGEPGKEAPIEGKPDAVEFEKLNNIKNKFGNDREKMVDGLVNLGQKLGKQVDMNKINTMSEEELIMQYREAEKELGSTGNQPEQPEQNNEPDEIELLRQENLALQEFFKNLQNAQNPGNVMPQSYPQGNFNNQHYPQGYPQQPQMTAPQQPRDPNTGQFVSRDVGQGQMDKLELEKLDWDKVYDDPEYFNQYLEKRDKAIEQRLERKLQEEKMKEQQQQAEIMRRRQQEQQTAQYYQQEVNMLKQKYPDFDNYRQAAGEILKQNPYLAYIPRRKDQSGREIMSGLEMAYLRGKQNSMNKQQYQPQQMPQQQPQAQPQANYKQALRMPNSSASIPGQSQMSQDDVERQLLINNPGQSGGIFG